MLREASLEKGEGECGKEAGRSTNKGTDLGGKYCSRTKLKKEPDSVDGLVYFSQGWRGSCFRVTRSLGFMARHCCKNPRQSGEDMRDLRLGDLSDNSEQ